MGAREILESTYYGKADVYHYPQRETDGIVRRGERTLLFAAIPCALSQTERHTTTDAGGTAEIRYGALLFCAPEWEIPAGCEIEITQDGMHSLYRASGEAFRYVSHQEIALERMDHA